MPPLQSRLGRPSAIFTREAVHPFTAIKYFYTRAGRRSHSNRFQNACGNQQPSNSFEPKSATAEKVPEFGRAAVASPVGQRHLRIHDCRWTEGVDLCESFVNEQRCAFPHRAANGFEDSAALLV